MSNRVVCGLTVAGLVLIGWTLVGQDSSNFRASPSAVVGRYVVSSVSGSAIMCDSITGQTWVFVPQEEGIPESVWMPVKRLDTAEAVKQWKQQNYLFSHFTRDLKNTYGQSKEKKEIISSEQQLFTW